MKRLLFILILLSGKCFAQGIEQADRKIAGYLERMVYLRFEAVNPDPDSLSIYNELLHRFMLDFLRSDPSTLHAKFERASAQNLQILSSPDGRFRVYCWNTQEGGTMRYYKSIFQYSDSNKVVVQPIDTLADEDFGDANGEFYYELNQLSIQNKNYYLLSSIGIASSALYYYKISIKTINDSLQLTDALLIKNDSSLCSELDYEIDLTNRANKENAMDYMSLLYDSKKTQIILPYLKNEEKVTRKKVIYQFKNGYFVKKSYGPFHFRISQSTQKRCFQPVKRG